MIHPPAHIVKRIALLLAALGCILWLGGFFAEISILVLLAFLLSFVLTPFVDYLEQRGINRTTATILTFLGIGALIGIGLWVSVPIFLNQLKLLADMMKHVDMEQQLLAIGKEIEQRVPFLKAVDVARGIHETSVEMMNDVLNNISKIFSLLMLMVVVPFIAFFIVRDGRKSLKSLIERVPNRYFEITLNLVDRLGHELSGYIRGWLLDSFVVGIMMIVGYYIIGMKYAFVLGAISGITNLVPYVGPVAGVIPAVIIAMIQGGSSALVVNIVILTLIVQLIDNTAVQPWAFATAINMHPLPVLIIVLLGNEFGGVIGMLLAIPIATVIKVTAKQAYWGFTHYTITKTQRITLHR
jgi:predicted PurR-regulated permease PerM